MVLVLGANTAGRFALMQHLTFFIFLMSSTLYLRITDRETNETDYLENTIFQILAKEKFYRMAEHSKI